MHIHVRVSLGGNVVHTGQLYFPDSVSDAVYKRKPYSSRAGRATRNPDDSIYRNGGSRSTLKLRKVKSAYTGSITMGVQRIGRKSGDFRPRGVVSDSRREPRPPCRSRRRKP